MNLFCSELFIYIHKKDFFSIYIFTAVLFVYKYGDLDGIFETRK